MPAFRCVECSHSIEIDAFAGPYTGEISCSVCRTSMNVKLGGLAVGTEVRRNRPRLEGIRVVRERLDPMELESLEEAAAAFSVGAYTACELMALRAVEHLMRRVLVQPRKTFGALLKDLQADTRLRGHHGVLDYFRTVRNGAAHPEKMSTREEAESTLVMAQRLVAEILARV